MFSAGKIYYMVPAALGLGCLLPIPGYILHRMYPKNTFFANFNTGVVVQYSCFLSGAFPLSTFRVLRTTSQAQHADLCGACSRYQYIGQYLHGHRHHLSAVGQEEVPEMVHKVYVYLCPLPYQYSIH